MPKMIFSSFLSRESDYNKRFARNVVKNGTFLGRFLHTVSNPINDDAKLIFPFKLTYILNMRKFVWKEVLADIQEGNLR